MAGDRIVIRGITGFGHHGVLPEERREGQEFIVDLTLGVSTARAGESDRLEDTVDYASVAIDAHALIVGEPVDLIETLAERIARACLARPGVRDVEVVVHKPGAPIPVPFGDVAVRIHRRRRERAALGIGANLEDRLAALRGAVAAIERLPRTDLVSVSSVYATDPVGGPEQPEYLNAVAIIETELGARELLRRCQRIEREWGRVRDVRWGPRTLDIDILALGSRESSDPSLTLPHPRAGERAFVLLPWAEADPTADLPGRGPIAPLAAAIGADGVRRRPDLALVDGPDPGPEYRRDGDARDADAADGPR